MISQYLRSVCCDAPVEYTETWQLWGGFIHCTGCWVCLAMVSNEDHKTLNGGGIPNDCW